MKFFKKLLNYTSLILIGVYTLKLYIDGKLNFYIHPRYFDLSLFASIVLITVSLLWLVNTIFKYLTRDKSIKDQPNDSFIDNKFIFILIIPIIGIITPLGFIIAAIFVLIPWKNSKLDKFIDNNFLVSVVLIGIFTFSIFTAPKTLSTKTLEQRINNLNSFSGLNTRKSIDIFQLDSTQFSIGDWTREINMDGNLSKFEGKEVDLIGFVFKPSDLPSEYFLISRFAISCCVLDATPIGLTVKYETSDLYESDDWIQVKGKFQIENINGKEKLVIIPSSIEKTEIPNNPYIG